MARTVVGDLADRAIRGRVPFPAEIFDDPSADTDPGEVDANEVDVREGDIK